MDVNKCVEVVRCPYCGSWMDVDMIERPLSYCHHDIFPDPNEFNNYQES